MPIRLSFRNIPRVVHIFTLVCLFGSLLIFEASAQAQVSIAWATRYGDPGEVMAPVAVASDAQGNVYVVGYDDLTGSAPHRETLTIKYDSSGNILWANWLGSSEHPSQGQAIGLDSDANVYVLAAIGLTTSSTATIANSEFAIIKYDSAGARQWVDYIPPASGGDNFPREMAVTSAGDVYVTGASYPADHSSSQVLTMKFATTGHVLWSHLDPTPGAGTNVPMGFGLDATENVYVAVQSSHFYPTIYKLDSAGNLRGTFVSQDLDDFTAFYVDALGNSYAAGCWAPGPVAIKWDSNGNELWKHSFTPTRCFSGIQVDSHGAVAIAETLGSSNTQIALADLDANGNLQWENILSDYGKNFSESLNMDSNGQIYLTGLTGGNASAFKFTPDGQQIWVQQYTDGSNMVTPRASTLAPGDRLVVTSDSVHFSVNYVESDIVTFALSQTSP